MRKNGSVGLDAKLAFLRRPESYPRHPVQVETVQTHMSWVFLAGDRVYKLKKPVRNGYLDFGTLELRRLACRRELRLNRRLAPDVYLGVVPLIVDRRGRLHLGGDPTAGTIVEWLVEMRRLPAEAMLDHKIALGTLTDEDVRRAGSVLIRFYRDAPPVRMTARTYRRRFREDVEDVRRQLAVPLDTLSQERVREITGALLASLDRCGELLDERVAGQRIVEAHGDLRPQHICLTEPPVVIDCLEFRRDFRLLDPVDELAYLAMECERLGAAWAGDRLLAIYQEDTGDRPSPALVTFYKAFRAFLRGKIAYLHIREPGNPAPWVALTKRYLDLAAGELTLPSAPRESRHRGAVR